MSKNKNKDTKQDIAIAELKVIVKNLEKRLDTFITNDFQGLKKKVEGIENKILYGFIVMIAATIIAQILLSFWKQWIK